MPEITFSQFLSADARALLTANGKQLIEQIGMDVIRNVVLDILTGRNLRNSTEVLTRRRIAMLNLATLQLFVQGSAHIDNFVSQLPYLASDLLTEKGHRKEERWLAQWILGLTDKGVQNILRDDITQLAEYRTRYIETCADLIQQAQQESGTLSGHIQLEGGASAQLNWLFMVYLLNTIGSQTLTIRGSDKSTYGKLFEKLVLGSLLSILGFEYRKSGDIEHPSRIFLLSSNDDDRESDATLLYEAGKGIRFDIGFIGRGNTEISLDKVSRYNREIVLGRRSWYMGTIILVDRIGKRSQIEQLAEKIDGHIVQMSAGYWPQRIARLLQERLGFSHPLVSMEHDEIEGYLKGQLQNVPLETFIDVVVTE